MRAPDTVWQGCFGDWQPLFIREYWLILGHLAWQGFLHHGPGMVVCEIHSVTATVDWSRTAVPYTARFVPQAELALCWQDLNLAADQRPVVDNAVATYDPAQDAILLLLGDSEPYISCLKGWAVPPPECSRQMGDRSAEFVIPPTA
ncbi:MAG: hypothetical protein ACFCVB_08865 [Nodosilinea sp.]